MANFQTFASQLGNDFLDRCGFMQLDKLTASPTAIASCWRFAQRKQFLTKLGVEQIQIAIILVKLADLSFIMKITHRFLISLPHLDQVGWKFAGLRIPLGEICLKIAAVAAYRFTQFREFLERFENILQLYRRDFIVVGKIFQSKILCAQRDEYFV